MGCVNSGLDRSAEDRQASKDIDREGRKAAEEEARVKKLLLLGAGESGKSTLFKQMIALYGKGFTETDLAAYTHVVYNNLVESMKELVRQCTELPEEYGTRLPTTAAGPVKLVRHATCNAAKGSDIDPVIKQNVCHAIHQLWQLAPIKSCYQYRSQFQLPDSASYYFSRLDAIAAPDYRPSQQDVLRSRVRTTGIVETEFFVDNHTFRMFDVGGQRNERKKWIHCFENVKAVIFVAAISEYDQNLYEDESANRIMEALELFDEICNSRWFRDTSIILFLNKRDLFEDKIRRVPLTVCFPEFAGTPGNIEEAEEYVKNQFLTKNRCKKDIYAHTTCATDSSNVKLVFDIVVDIIMREALDDSGLI